jgi:hypothetical protein
MQKNNREPVGNLCNAGDIFRSLPAMQTSTLASQPILKVSALPPLEVDATIDPLQALVDSALCTRRSMIGEELLYVVAHLC